MPGWEGFAGPAGLPRLDKDIVSGPGDFVSSLMRKNKW